MILVKIMERKLKQRWSTILPISIQNGRSLLTLNNLTQKDHNIIMTLELPTLKGKYNCLNQTSSCIIVFVYKIFIAVLKFSESF